MEQQFDEDLLCWQDLWHLWIPLALNRSALPQPTDCGRCLRQHFKPQPIFAFTPITRQQTFPELSSSQLQLTCKALGFSQRLFLPIFLPVCYLIRLEMAFETTPEFFSWPTLPSYPTGAIDPVKPIQIAQTLQSKEVKILTYIAWSLYTFDIL